MEQKVIMYSAVCSFAPHSQDVIEAIPHLYVSEWIRPMLVWKQLSLTHAGLEKLILDGIEFASLINVWNQEVFFAILCSILIPPIMLHWCLTGQGFSAVAVQQAQMCVLI